MLDMLVRSISGYHEFCLHFDDWVTSLKMTDVVSRDMTLPWWRHQMEAFSALLALCAGNSPVTGEFPAQSQWRGALMFSLICAWINSWVNNGEAGDLRRPRAHYGVTAMPRVLSTFTNDPVLPHSCYRVGIKRSTTLPDIYTEFFFCDRIVISSVVRVTMIYHKHKQYVILLQHVSDGNFGNCRWYNIDHLLLVDLIYVIKLRWSHMKLWWSYFLTSNTA